MDPLRIARRGRAWSRGHAQLLVRQRYDVARNAARGATDAAHLDAALDWLERAQDATPDGGFVGRYRLDRGWTSSYPETTGYIIPTLLRAADKPGRSHLRQRAERAVGFLLGLQHDSGAFPGAEIDENRRRPSPFNTAQIVHGLVAWHRETDDPEALAAARRAADWLCSVQDDDGAFRQHFYNDEATAYAAHLSCWLAELGAHCGEARYLEACGRHLDQVLGLVDPETGWFECSGFDREQIEARVAFTHTIAYTVWGVLHGAEILGRDDGIDAARRAAVAIARRLELSRGLPGRLDWRWRSDAEFCCLTGNAQMALIWFRLFERDRDPRLLNAALRAIDEVKRAQVLDNPNPDLRGGIPGSAPIWGDYIRFGIPNWAAKYFVDALLEKQRVLAGLELPVAPRALPPWPTDVARQLPQRAPAGPATRTLRVGLLSSPRSRKLGRLLDACDGFGFSPDLVLLEEPPQPSRSERLLRRIENQGVGGLLARFRRRGAEPTTSPAAPTAAEVCARRNLPSITVAKLDAAETLAIIRDRGIDLLVHAGAGILRPGLLAAPALGTLNAHMGLLPLYRGMNVAEWSAFTGGPIGCTIHLIDPGIDTGPILWSRRVEGPWRNIAELRAAVDDAQIAALAETLRWILVHGELPPRREQRPDEGIQLFTMHDELRTRLDAMLAASG